MPVIGEPPIGQSAQVLERRKIVSGLFVFLAPFFFFFRVLVPDWKLSLMIGNDFHPLYYTYKRYLLDRLAEGHFPFWSPGESCGYPFFSNPFAQAFYPLNWLLLLLRQATGSYTMFDHQAFAVLGIGIFSLGLFLWLSQLVPNRRAVLFATLLIAVSYKMGETLRFPNAVHTAAWIPWILFGITLAANRMTWLRGALVIFPCSIMLLTAGYLYYAYYCIFLIPPYVLLLMWRTTRETLLGSAHDQTAFSWRLFASAVLVAPIAALAVCTPYLLKINQLLEQTVDRTGWDYAYIAASGFSPIETLGSLVFPPVAQAEGWYYFSIVGALLISLYILMNLYPKKSNHHERLFLVIFLAWFFVISAITYGENSFIFEPLWHAMPGFSKLRCWARMNIILLPIFAVTLARAYTFFEYKLTENVVDGTNFSRRRYYSIAVIAVVTAIIAVLQVFLYFDNPYNGLWMVFFKRYHGLEWSFFLSTAISGLVLCFLLLFAGRHSLASSRARIATFISLLCVSWFDLYPIGSGQWMIEADRGLLNILESPKKTNILESFVSPRVRIYNTITSPNFNVGWINNWYFERYLNFDRTLFPNEERQGMLYYGRIMDVREIDDQEQLPYYARLIGLQNGQKVFLSKQINHDTVRDFIIDANKTAQSKTSSYEIQAYDGDSLQLRIDSSTSVYVSFIDNWDPDWRATIDEKTTEIKKLFGTFKSVRISPGTHTVRFVYLPFG
ncbi:MAG: YfhO family protein [Deltaproteobacteria bacterium]|nr:YfhO family protein [Deltaproteobacteria bacterium]